MAQPLEHGTSLDGVDGTADKLKADFALAQKEVATGKKKKEAGEAKLAKCEKALEAATKAAEEKGKAAEKAKGGPDPAKVQGAKKAADERKKKAEPLKASQGKFVSFHIPALPPPPHTSLDGHNTHPHCESSIQTHSLIARGMPARCSLPEAPVRRAEQWSSVSPSS